MMSSGINIADDIASEYNNLRMKRQHRYLIFKLSDDNSGVIID